MKVLCLCPVMSKALCDTYSMYVKLRKMGVDMLFISGRSSGARANSMKLQPYENMDGVPIYRLYKNSNEMLIFPQKKLKQVLKIAKRLNPDLILCYLADNMRLALLLRRYFKIPIVLHVENAGDILSQKFVDSWKMRPVRHFLREPTRGPRYWSWLCEKADVLITSHPPDQQRLHLLSEHGKPVYYLPWPTNIPEDCELPTTKDRRRGIYAGNLAGWKNTQAFGWILPLIFQNTPTKEFIIIGVGHDSLVIERLMHQFGDAIKYIPRLPRCEVIKLVAGSYYAFTPTTKGGWGFFGDCWGTGTPILMLHDVFRSKELDISVAKSEEDLLRKINRLYDDPLFYRQLQGVGYTAFDKRKADVIGDELYAILSRTIDREQDK